MTSILSEQDTFFGTIAYRNKLITVEQLQEGVQAVQESNNQLRLGDYFLQTGYMSEEEVQAILDMQQAQRHALETQQKKMEPVATPPLPKPEAPKVVLDSSLFSLPRRAQARTDNARNAFQRCPRTAGAAQ